MSKTFSAQVDAWVKESRARLEAVVKQSAQMVAEEVKRPKGEGGHMPVDTGFLRASLMASTSAMPTISKSAQPTAGSVYSDNAGEIALVIANAKLGDPIYLGFTAAYAAFQEYGVNGKSGNRFVGLTAQRWPAIVNETARNLRARVERP